MVEADSLSWLILSTQISPGSILIRCLGVGTLGSPHFAMATGKLPGFDLLPGLANLSSRKLYLPTGIGAPLILESLTERVKVSRLAREGWDGRLQLVASLKAG